MASEEIRRSLKSIFETFIERICVIFLRIERFLEWFSFVHQPFRKLHRVLKQNIVVDNTVQQKKMIL